MNWQVLILMHTGLAACNSLQKRGLMRQPLAGSAPLAVNAISLIGLYLTGLCLIPLLGGVDVAAAWQYAVPILLAAALFTVAGICNTVSFAHLETSVASMVSTVSTLCSVTLAWLLFGERLTLLQAGGVAVLFLTVLYVMRLGRGGQKATATRRQFRGICFGLGGALLFGLGLVVERYAVSNVSIATYLTFGWGLQACGAVGLAMLRPAQLRVLRNKRVISSAALLGITGASAGILFLLAQVHSHNLSLVSSLANIKIVMIAVAAGILFHERNQYRRRIGAAVVAMLGVSLIMWH